MNKIKLFGIIGAGLLCFGYLPAFTVFFSIAGFVFLAIALNILNFYKKGKYFESFLTGAVMSVTATFLFYFKLFAIISSVIIAMISNNPVVPLTFSIIGYFLIYYILVIFSSYFFYRSFYEVYMNFGNQFFRYAGILMIIGAVLTIFGIGFVIEIIGWVILIFGFVTLKDEIIVEIEVEKIGKKD